MARSNITTAQPGQITELQEKAVAQLPTGPALEEEGPELSSFADLVGDTAPPVAPEPQAQTLTTEEAQAADLERGRVPTITERAQQVAPPTRYNPRSAMPVISDDGGIGDRAKGFAAKWTNNSKALGGLGFSPSETTPGTLDTAFNNVGAITNKAKVTNPDGTAGFQTDVDPGFLHIGTAVTENIITRLAEGSTPTLDFQQEKQDVETKPKGEVTKHQANVELGQEINREYQRVKNQKAGLPSDEYSDISADDAAVIGDVFKEMYAETYPNLLRRTTPELGDQVAFQLTPEGDTVLNSPAAKLRRAVLFPGTNVRPNKTPIKGQLKTEVGRVATRAESSKVKAKPQGKKIIEDAKRNLSEVPNVVNTQRLKIAYATVLPALMDQDPEWRDIHSIGSKQINKFAAEAKKAEREGKDYDPTATMQGIENNLANSLRALAMERKGANFLSYYTQNFNGRIAPQQSFFDPTSSKLVRFATTNAVPAKATPGSRVERNLRQMYAMMLVKDADSLLPAGRDTALEAAAPQLEAWGNELATALDNAITDAQAEEISQAIEEGKPVNEFPSLPVLEVSPELKAKILKKGEDGPHFIDGLIDFAKYAKAKRDKQPYFSYFNAYMDGKTNGIASNGIQMGSKEVALKTGVLRGNTNELLDSGDVRDALMANLTEELETSGIQTSEPNMYTVANSIYNYRQLAKDTTMTYGYGKELESFKEDIDGALDLMIEEDPNVAAAMEAMMQDKDRDAIVDDLWSSYVNHLGAALSEEALQSRPLMRAAATYFALMDKVFSIDTATGFELNLGGEIATGEVASEQTYKIHGDKSRSSTATRYKTRSTSLARKGDQGPGSRAYGGSLPGPVQSIDAATVALTASGRSWNKLKDASNGNPYLHTIYDAFKVDAMGYDVVLDEVNKNWLDASMNWSYLESTMNSLQDNMKDFRKELNQYPDSLPILTGPDDEFGMFGELTQQYESEGGTYGPWPLAKMLTKVKERGSLGNDEHFFAALDDAKAIMNRMSKEGFDPAKPTIKDFKLFLNLFSHSVQLQPRLSKMINHTNSKKKELKKEIQKGGVPVYQYYAH